MVKPSSKERSGAGATVATQGGLRRLIARLCVVAIAAPIALAVVTGASSPALSATGTLPNLRDSYGPGIDPYQPYQGQSTCRTSIQPGTADLAKMLKATFPSSNPWTYIRACGVGGTSEHKDGRAIDWMLDSTKPADSAIADQFIAWITATDKYGNPNAMARRLGIMYIIWKGKLLPLYKYSNFAWKANTGHFDHIHISLSWAGALRQTSYWTKYYPYCAPENFPGCPVKRLSGTDRYATSVAIGRQAAPEAGNVVLASGEQASLVDALAAGPLAAAVRGPLLLTARSGLPAAVRADVVRRSPSRAYVVGGTASVSDAVVADLRGLGVSVTRLSGATRYETAAAVARAIRARTGSGLAEVVLASGDDEHLIDALGGGSLAAVSGGAVLLTEGGTLGTAAAGALRDVAPAQVTVAGSDSVLSGTVMTGVSATGFPARRAAGADRYGTAAALADLSADVVGVNARDVVVASGNNANMVDAIPGAALRLPLLLSTPAALPAVSQTWVGGRSALTGASVVGGPSAVSARALDQVYFALASTPQSACLQLDASDYDPGACLGKAAAAFSGLDD